MGNSITLWQGDKREVIGLYNTLKSYEDLLDSQIREEKQTLIYALDSMEQTMAYQKQKLEATLDDSTKTGSLNSVGILQRQGQMIESRCMEIVTKAKHLTDLRQIVADGQSES